MKLAKLVLFSLSLIASAARADRRGSDAREFIPVLKSFIRTCSETSCQARQIYSRDKQVSLISDMTPFEKIAWEQAQVWADTILEGDYQAEGETRLDAVFALYRDGQLIGYRIVYSERAWDMVTRESGRIVEASFISPSLKTYVTDENQFAEFHASK